jgi:hypothetical protein
MINGESIEIRFPSKEENYENWQSARSSRLYVYTNCAANSGKSSAFEDVSSFLISSAVDIPSGLKCRLPRDPHNPVIARYWLSECLRSHEKCQANSKSVLQANRPFRLVNVSLADVDGDPYLEEGATEGDYLTLSYCWGDPSTVTTTTKESLEEFKHRIPFASLSRIFKDAIEFTRLLGIKYIWIDALCIVQDSPEDKTREIPRMADIYAASLLTLSACRATSGESRLFEPRVVHNLVKLPVQRAENPNALLYVTNQDLYGFSDDVPEGNLGSRGWCFQERLLTTRLLHFGKDQLHWECHEALQSESNTKEFWYDDLISSDDCKLREKFVSDIVFQEPLAHPSEPLGPNATEEANARWNKFVDDIENLDVNKEEESKRKLEMARRRPQFDAWYSAVSSYTSRSLTNARDKLPALSGAAARFGTFIKDTYAAGLWAADMSHGLLWSRTAFENVKIDEAIAVRPGLGGRGDQQRTAPTWSWASVEGAVHWVRDRDGLCFLGAYAAMLQTESQGVYGEPDWAAIRVKGHLLEISEISLLRDEAKQPELRTDFEKRLATYTRRQQPQMDFDDPGFEAWLRSRGETRPLYLLLVSEIAGREKRVGNGGETVQTTSQLGELGYALLLRYWPHDGACRRVGIAQVALRDFFGSEIRDIHIL